MKESKQVALPIKIGRTIYFTVKKKKDFVCGMNKYSHSTSLVFSVIKSNTDFFIIFSELHKTPPPSTQAPFTDSSLRKLP